MVNGKININDGVPPPDSATMPLSSMADAFEELAKMLKGRLNGSMEQEMLRLDHFCQVCYLVSFLFDSLGLAFKFAELEYITKLHVLVEASKRFDTLGDILDPDIAHDKVKTAGSFSRNLRRVRQGLDLIRAIFENFFSTDDNSLREAASTAYAQVCAPYHTWTVRTAVAAGMYTLPTRDQLLSRFFLRPYAMINVIKDQSAEEKMRRYINAPLPIIEYIDELYLSRNIILDW